MGWEWRWVGVGGWLRGSKARRVVVGGAVLSSSIMTVYCSRAYVGWPMGVESLVRLMHLHKLLLLFVFDLF